MLTVVAVTLAVCVALYVNPDQCTLKQCYKDPGVAMMLIQIQGILEGEAGTPQTALTSVLKLAQIKAMI